MLLKKPNINRKSNISQYLHVTLHCTYIINNKGKPIQDFSMTETTTLVKTITKGIQDKKGKDIVIADLSHIDGAIANYFVICQGSSPNQVEAIAEAVAGACREEMSEKPVGVNGLGNNQWIAIDFVDVLVHIFQPDTREFYNLEELWEDAKLTKIPNID